MSDRIKVFVGCAANHEDVESQSVFEYTLRKHASVPVDITWMKLSRNPDSPYYSDPEAGLGWDTSRWATPFSGFRWAIPEWCGFEGRAIYADSDVIFQADIAELWNTELLPPRVVAAKGQGGGWRLCVSLWDCARTRKFLQPVAAMQRDPDAHRRMARVFSSNPGIVQVLSDNWNCLDGEDLALDDPSVKALHYTSMKHQPHLQYAVKRLASAGQEHWFDGNPEVHWRSDLVKLFDRLLVESQVEFPLSRYEQDPYYGPYRKMSVKHQGKVRPHWGR